jgi:hypothetical protein
MDAHTQTLYPVAHGCAAPAAGAAVEALVTFERFAAAMSHHGLAAQPLRMLCDKLYAHEQIALAHSTADRDLRHLAVALFHRLTDGPPGI